MVLQNCGAKVRKVFVSAKILKEKSAVLALFVFRIDNKIFFSTNILRNVLKGNRFAKFFNN